MFPNLRPLDVAEGPLAALGQPGGDCDGAGQDMACDSAAGWPFFGQLIAHDITADRSLVTHGRDEVLVNSRAAKLDLECVYAGGPTGSVYIYDYNDGASFLLGTDGADLPRNAQGIAIIGDARNDSHFVINRLHLALMQAHNILVARLRASGTAPAALFDEARRRVTWFYQWVVINEYLPMLVDSGVIAKVMSGETASAMGSDTKIPIEFADAVFRYGHSQIRPAYQLQTGGPMIDIFPDLLGFRPVPPERQINFRLFFDGAGQGRAQRSMPISEKMQTPIIRLPAEITGTLVDETYRSLAARDLRRGLSTALPSGEDVARAMGIMPLTPADIGTVVSAHGTPLFYYILREAAMFTGGNRLGPVGGRIVADVLISLMRRDPASYLSRDPAWHPASDALLQVGPDAELIDLLELSQSPMIQE
ncbi:MAG: peroxidase family protein [Alphaproteobacteria bacterium]